MNNCRWEIHLDDVHFNSFCKLMDDNGFGGFTAAKASNGTWWIICYPSDEIKLMAKLRFQPVDIIYDFTDYPNP